MTIECNDTGSRRRGVLSQLPSLGSLAFLSLGAAAYGQPDYAPAHWKPPSCTKWYTSGYGHHFCVIHDMEGYYASCISYLNRCDTDASGNFNVATSVYYMVNSLKNGSDEDGHAENNSGDVAAGDITQAVRESVYAWHARCWNQYMFGTEHEGFASSPAWYSEAMYLASASLQRHLCDAYNIPKDRNHIIGHNEKKTASWVSWMQANWPAIDPTCNTHTDPGQYWDWTHFMALIVAGPAAPTSLTATPLSTNSVKLVWTDNATNESGFKIERALASAGPWSQIATTAVNVAVFTNTGLAASTVYYYQVRAYNANGDSAYSNVRSVTTGNLAPTLAVIGSKAIVEGNLLTFTVAATDPGTPTTSLVTDFESYAAGTMSTMFRQPHYSGSTDEFVDTTVTNYSMVTGTFPAGHSSSRVVRCTWNFTNGPANSWLRLTTAGASGVPNPVIDFRQVLKFDIYTDKALKVALGCRETTTAAGTAIGSDGGTTGSIEWIGATGSSSGRPTVTRTVGAGSWQTLSFNIPYEAVTSFAGDGVLSTASGLGVLEHLAFVPTVTSGGTWNVYLDNFSVVASNTVTYSLDAGAPAGASINPITGVFTWRPTEDQGPNTYEITIRATDNGSPPLNDFETILVAVYEANSAPALAAIGNKTVAQGDLLTFTASATDTDAPPNLLTFSLDPGAPDGASIDPTNGVFTWTPGWDQAPGDYSITVRATDDGPPNLSAARTFSVTVNPGTNLPPIIATASVSASSVTLEWSAVMGKVYRVQYKEHLGDTNWLDLGPDVTANGSTASQTSSSTNECRFYRIVRMN